MRGRARKAAEASGAPRFGYWPLSAEPPRLEENESFNLWLNHHCVRALIATEVSMSCNRLAARVAAAIFVTIYSSAVSAQQPINIEKWPDDVPCDALKKGADGSYEMTVPWVRFYSIHTGGKWKNTRETAYWNQKCKGKTQ
jgi:hypothetical protein